MSMSKKNPVWEVRSYWDHSIMATDYMAEDMNLMSKKGYEVYQISLTPSRAELSHYPDGASELTDGDHFSISSTTWIWYRK